MRGEGLREQGKEIESERVRKVTEEDKEDVARKSVIRKKERFDQRVLKDL